MAEQLEVVLQLRQKVLDKASERLQQVEQQLQTLKQQATALEDYALDYQKQLASEGVIGIQQRQLLVAYLNQVQTAVIGQYEKISQAEHQVVAAKAVWMDAHLQTKAIEKLIEARKKLKQQATEKREQQASDALSQVRFVANQRD
ncbi:MAG: flagellar export protein FliJ [Gammaproteobacteria bacterium]|nr:flagellar export protein FliJ [Gammaproteobacteria bacterium]